MADPLPPVGKGAGDATVTLRQRADFLAANGGLRVGTPAFVLLVKHRDDGTALRRIGYTVTKKIGNAVVRNRIRRRFRAMVHQVLGEHGIAGADHVLIGRAEAMTRDFAAMRDDLVRALARVRDGKAASDRRPQHRKPRRR